MIVLPAILNPISRRKDKSVLLKFDTRELKPDETLSLMQLEGTEGWLHFSPNKLNSEEINFPETNAVVSDLESPSKRLMNALYRLYLQDVKQQKYVGIFQNYYNENMEKYISHTLNKIL